MHPNTLFIAWKVNYICQSYFLHNSKGCRGILLIILTYKVLKYQDVSNVVTFIVATCEPIWISTCNNRSIVPYSQTLFPNHMGQVSQQQAANSMSAILPVIESECHPYANRMMCALYVPKCDQAPVPGLLPPCRTLCTGRSYQLIHI